MGDFLWRFWDAKRQWCFFPACPAGNYSRLRLWELYHELVQGRPWWKYPNKYGFGWYKPYLTSPTLPPIPNKGCNTTLFIAIPLYMLFLFETHEPFLHWQDMSWFVGFGWRDGDITRNDLKKQPPKWILAASFSEWLFCNNGKPSWWFQFVFKCSSLPGEMIQFDEYFLNRLKPPTRNRDHWIYPFWVSKKTLQKYGNVVWFALKKSVLVGLVILWLWPLENHLINVYNPWLFRVYIGNYTLIIAHLCGDYFINHYKDLY